MLKPERVTFSADDDKFHQFPDRDQLTSFLDDSLVHYSTDFKNPHQQQSTSVKHSTSLDELSAQTMSSQQQQQQQQQTEHEPPASAPPSIVSEQVPALTENNLRQFDALTLQQLATGSQQLSSSNNTNDENLQTSPARPASLVDVQKEIDRVRQMKYGRTYSSPTSSLCSRLSINPFNGSNTNIDLSSLTNSVQFTEQSSTANRLPFSSTYITSIPESIVPASGSSSTNDNHFIPIHHIESPSLEDREVFETFHSKQSSVPGVAIRQSTNSLNRNISTSETDLIASLHRSASKQALDTQSEHGTTYSGTSDDVIFVEWDKERGLFQDYINSLRTEIRVLLQERSEYQRQMETINDNLSEHKRLNMSQIHSDQTNYELLQKSLEEKNLVLEQLQKEYEAMKEKNTNLTRKISNLRCDGKAQTGVIDELKQKIAELTVDIQNHVLVKRRLEVSMLNLESDCKLIDAERIRLTNDVKDVQLSRQDFERLLQQANVQLAEQGSTIEMLRSDNIQIRSQLSATQRRMLQEKQQVMDYLRQIENDLIEKEQIKQRENLLRKEFEKLQQIQQHDRQVIEQLNSQIDQDKQKITQLEQERVQLLKTIQNLDDKQTHVEAELDTYKSATKRLYSHFKIPFESIQTVDQLIPMIENRYRTEQVSHARVHNVPLVQSSSPSSEAKIEQNTEESLASLTMQLKQLEEANQAWQQYQQNQVIVLRDRLQLTDVDNASFDDMVQQIEDRFTDLNNQLVQLESTKNTAVQSEESDNMNVRVTKDTQTEDVTDEVEQLREDLARLTAQCAQLDEANRAWQSYHQTQLDGFTDKLRQNLSIENSLSLDDIAQEILAHLHQIEQERENISEQLQVLEKRDSESTRDDQGIAQTHLNEQLDLLKQQNEQLETEKYILNQQIGQLRATYSPSVQKQIREAQIHHISPVQSASPSINENEQEIQQLKQNITLLTNQCAQLDEANRAWQLYQQTQTDSFRDKLQHHLPIDENITLDQIPDLVLNQLGKIDDLTQQLNDAAQSQPPTQTVDEEEVRQLRENLVTLTSQLDETNRAWQEYQQTQLHLLRNQLQNHFSLDSHGSFDDIVREVVDQVTREREDSDEKVQALHRVNNDLRSTVDVDSVRETYMNKMNELNDELMTMRDAYERMDGEKQALMNELEQRANEASRRSVEKVSSDVLRQPFAEVPIHQSGIDSEEVQQLRESVATLSAQCAQLDEANRAWQMYQETQANNFKSKLQDYFPVDESLSFDQIPEIIIVQSMKEREDMSEKLQALEKVNSDLQSETDANLESIRQSYANTVNELTQELLAVKQAYEQLDAQKQQLTDELGRRSIEKVSSDALRQPFAEVPIHRTGVDSEEVQQLRESVATLSAQCAQLNEANRAWQMYQETQANNFRSKLQDYLPIDESIPFDQIPELVIDQLTKEPPQTEDKVVEDRPSASIDDLEAVRESYTNTVSELTQELLAMKEAYAQLDDERQALLDELEKRPVPVTEQSVKQTTDIVSEDAWNEGLKEVPLQSSSASVVQNEEELQQLREDVVRLTTQCAQLEEANRAWQTYQQTQTETFRNSLQNFLPIDDNLSLDQIAEQLVEQISKERQTSQDKYTELEKVNSDLQSELTADLESIKESYTNTVDELNQELLAMKEAYEQLDNEKQALTSELEKRPVTPTTNGVQDNLTDEISLQTNLELDQLREDFAALTSQYAQLNEANEAWQQFHQSQLNKFRQQIQDHLPIAEDSSFDQMAQQIIDQIAQQADQYDELVREKDLSLHQIETLESTNKTLLEQQTEMSELRESLRSLTTQFSDKYQSWDDFQHKQSSLLKSLLPFSNKISLEDIIEEIISYIHQLKTEVEFYKEKEQQSETMEKLGTEEDLVSLQTANQAWQTFYDNQIDFVKEKFSDWIPSDENLSFEQIIELLAMNSNHLKDQQRTSNDELERQLQENQTAMNFLNNENEQLKEQLSKFEKRVSSYERPSSPFVSRRTPIQDVPIHRLSSVQASSSPLIGEDELEQLRANLSALTAQCAQLDEANRAWQLYHQNQLDIFRQKLQDCVFLEENLNLEQIAQQIIDQFSNHQNATDMESLSKQLVNYQLNESILSQNLEQLNKKLGDVHHECEEFRENNANLISTQQQIEQQNELLGFENQQLKSKVTELAIQRIDSPREKNVGIHNIDQSRDDEIQQLRIDLAAALAQCAQLDEANQAWQNYQQEQIESFRNNLQEQIPSLNQLENPALDVVAQQILNYLQRLNGEKDNLVRQNDSLKEEIQVHKYNSERPGSAENGRRIYRRLSQERHLREAHIHNVSPVQSASPSINENEQEIQQLKQNITLLTNQCAQLDEANRAWQLYQQTQTDSFRDKLQHHLPIDENITLDQIPDVILTQLDKERHDFTHQYHALEKINDELRSESQANSEMIDDLNQQLSDAVQSQPPTQTVDEEEVRQLRQNLLSLTSQLDETNRAWQEDQQTQLHLLRNQLQNHFSLDSHGSFDDIVREVVDQVTREREDSDEKVQALHRVNNDLRSTVDVDSVRETYMNKMNELNDELMTMRDAYERMDGEKQALMNELEQRANEASRRSVEKVSSDVLRQPFAEVPIHQSGIDSEEVQQLRESVATLSAQCAQLDEANRAWQMYQETQANNFRSKLQDYLPIDESVPFDQIPELVIDQLTKEPPQTEDKVVEDRPSASIDDLEAVRESYTNTVSELTQELLAMKEAYAQLDDERQALLDELEKRPVPVTEQSVKQTSDIVSEDAWNEGLKEVPLQSSSASVVQNEEELQQLREDVVRLTTQCAQLEEANRAWQMYQQSQADSFRSKLQEYISVDESIPFDQIPELIIDQLRRERLLTEDTLNQPLSSVPTDDLASIRQSYTNTVNELTQELLAMKEAYEQLDAQKQQLTVELERQSFEKVSTEPLKQLFNEVPIHQTGIDSEEMQQLRESVATLSAQCAQLDEANRAWQMYQQSQGDNFRTKLQDYLPIDESTPFDQIPELIIDQLVRERANSNFPSGDTTEPTEESQRNTADRLNEELLALKEAYDQIDREKQALINELEQRNVRATEIVPSSIWKQPFREVPIHTSSADVEELQQLRETVVTLTAQCTELNEANQVWRTSQENQLDELRAKLDDYLDLDDTSSLDDITQKIVEHLTKERQDLNEVRSELATIRQSAEQTSVENSDELNQELLHLKNQYEELAQLNNQLLIEKEDLINQLNDRSLVVGHHSTAEPNPFEEAESSIPPESTELHQIRSDLAAFTESTQNELHSFRNKLQNWISLHPHSTLDEIAQQLHLQFEQRIPPETHESQTQTNEPVEKVHRAMETIPLTQVHQTTQFEPREMIDQQIQTESLLQLWSLSNNDENLFTSDDEDDRLGDYVEEIASLSSTELTNRLTKDCEQILSKQNFAKDRYPSLDLNHLALITIYSLYHQHLTDDAKHLYNETLIRALKQEYELINNEKTDYMDRYLTDVHATEKKYHQLQNQYDELLEQSELERLHAKQSFNEGVEKYELKLNGFRQENERLKASLSGLQEDYEKIQEQNYEELNREYQQLRLDYDELINKNELLLNYNSEMYQRKVKTDDSDENGLVHDVDIQCNLLEENQTEAAWTNDWQEEKQANSEEIEQLKAIIEEMKLENQSLKKSLAETDPIRPDVENERSSVVQDIPAETNDWDNDMPSIDIPSDEQAQEKLTQVNGEVKQALQNIEERIHQAVSERPELFSNISADPIERLDRLILTIGDQAALVELVQNERDQAKVELENERSRNTEWTINSNQSAIEDYKDEIEQLRSLLQERNDLLRQQDIQSSESEREIEELKEQVDQLQQQARIESVGGPSEEEIQSLKDEIEEKSEELKDLSEKYFTLSSQLESNADLQARLNDYQNQVENLTKERSQLLEENRSHTASVQSGDGERHGGEQQQLDKMVKINTKLKRVLQTFKEKVNRLVNERPELFANVGEETTERFDHLIATVEHQATQIDMLQSEHSETEQQLRNEIQELQSSLEASRYQIETERPVRVEQLVASAPPPPATISEANIDEYENQIKQLQQKLSQHEDERQLLRERLNEVEVEFSKANEDRSSTDGMYEAQLQSLVQERNALVEQQALQSAESERQHDALQQALNAEIQSLKDEIEEKSEELRDLSDKYFALSSQLESNTEVQSNFDKDRNEMQTRLNDYQNQIENLTKERSQLLEEIRSHTSSVQSGDGERHGGEQQQLDKMVKINTKLKRVLQTFKEKVNRLVNERPELFPNVGEETTERFDHLIATVEHQATQIDMLQSEYSETEQQLRNEIQELQSSLETARYQIETERPVRVEQLVASAPPPLAAVSEANIDEYENQIKQLQQKLSQHEDERQLLRERLNEVEVEFSKANEDRSSTDEMYEAQLQSLVQERNALVEQQALQSAESEREIVELKQQLDQLQQAEMTPKEDIQSLQTVIQQQSEELKDISEKYFSISSQLKEQDELDREKKALEEQLNDYKSQFENLLREHDHLREEVRQKAASTVVEPTESEKASGADQQHEKLAKVNTKLKRVLQTFKEKINRLATERPEVFANVGEETSERLDHLIATVEHQATQIDMLQSEHNDAEEQLRNEIQELQNSLETCQNQLESERSKAVTQPLSSTASSDIEEYEQQINQLQQKLSQYEDERALLRERLNEVEVEFSKANEDRSSSFAMYEEQLQSLVQERNRLAEQQALQSAESERETDELKQELEQLRQSASTEDIQSLKDEIEEKSEELKDLSEKYFALASQLESNADLQARLNDYQNQIENLTKERSQLLEEIRSHTSSVQSGDGERHGGEQQQLDKMVKINTKLKRVLQTFKEKVNRLVTERPELFANVGEETTERFDHLIATVEHQATQLDMLQSEHNETEQQLRNEIQELQSSLETARYQIENERPVRVEQLVASAPPPPATISEANIDEYENQIKQLQQKLSQHEDERQLLRERLNEVELELAKTLDNHSFEERIQSLNAIIDQQSQQLALSDEKYVAVQGESNQEKESLKAQLSDLESQVDHLTRERSQLLEEIQNNASSSGESDKLAKMNTKLKRVLQTFKERINRLVTERPELFANVGEETSERLDHLITTVEHQAAQIVILQNERKEIEQQMQTSAPAISSRSNAVEHLQEIPLTQSLNENPSQTTDVQLEQQEPSVTNRIFDFFKTVATPWTEEPPSNDWNDQQSPLQLPSEESQSNGQILQMIQTKLQQLSSEYPEYFPHSTENLLDHVDQFPLILKALQNQIQDLQSSYETLSQQQKDQPMSSSIIEEDTQKPLPISSPTDSSSDQRISRRVFEQEILAWSKESEQLKQFVKQIQIENKKLKDIILKFERIIHDYMHENDRLKQENQQLSLLSYSLNTDEESSASDTDICYLTLKWLTYEVAQRISENNHEQSVLTTEESNDPVLRQRLGETERQLKTIRIQNQKLKKQLETYTNQIKHLQHEVNTRNQELTLLKLENDRLHTSETQYRLEVDRLKADLQCDQVKFQQLERELTDLKLEQSNLDDQSSDNLRELLQLKERELIALKDKLDYTIQVHQLELQEAIKSNQFSLDNVHRFEQLDQQHQVKRRELERRLGKICNIVRPLIDNQELFREESMIDIDALQQLITDTEAEQRVLSSLGPIRDCLGLLENQMKELQQNLIENHARRSKKTPPRFESEEQWDVETSQETDSTDLLSNDIHLSLDDVLDETVVRTTDQ